MPRSRRRVFVGAIVAAVVAFGVALPLAADGSTANATIRADVNDFEFVSMDVTYQLSRAADSTSVMQVTERIVAQFPQSDQNRGIIRTIPDNYDRVPLHTEVHSVVDDTGEPVFYELDYHDGLLDVILGTDEFVHGRQTYVISYSQHNVVRNFADTTGVDEFYWDVNGTGWRQPFGRVSATVIVDSEIASALTGAAACYRGPEGSDTACDSIEQLDVRSLPGTTTYLAEAADLAPGENLTVAIAFASGTFAQVEPQDPPPPPGPSLWTHILGIMLSLLAVGISVASIVMKSHAQKDHPGRGIIVPQYSVPKLLNVMVAANLVARSKAFIPSQLVSLAVRKKIRILGYPVGPGKAKYTLQLLDPAGVDPIEGQVLVALFGVNPQPNTVREIQPHDYTLGAALRKVTSTIPALAIDGGFRLQARDRGMGCAPIFAAMLLIAISFIALTFTESAPSAWLGLSAPLSFATFIIAAFCAARPAPLTAVGADHRDYLIGMKQYLELAEKDRFRILQSAEGAERIDIGDNRQVINLYEKLLPFAVLWGVELSWLRELAVRLEPDESPDWYVGTTAFSPAVFSSSLRELSASATSAPRSSGGGSFSGGSGGGGSSGGGGGGGGGGGR